MNMNRIRLYAQNALLIVLSMIVMAGAIGLSYKAHYCHGNLSGIAFYSGIGVQQSASCGCAGDDNSGKQQPAPNVPVLSKISCCSNVTFFSKLNIESPVNFISSLQLIQPAVIVGFSDNILQPVAEKALIPNSGFRSPPTLLAGRKLVLFLSQQRIPLISYNY
jgi:hypothetical protein